MQRAIPFVIYENSKFIISDEAKELLANDSYRNIGIMSLVGKYRTGKSFLLNRVLLNNKADKGFGVGPTFKPCTKGIWIWSDPLYITNKHCNETFPCFLIDTEGLCAYDEEINHDSKIFLIATLISSLFIFNSFGAIDETAINNLSFVLNLCKTIKLRNDTSSIPNESDSDKNSELAEYFPSLLWLLRDFHLKLEDTSGREITEKEYLERSLQNVKGSTDAIEEKNQTRSMIRTYFPERDCYTMVRPVENEIDLQNLQHLDNKQLRSEFVTQAKKFRALVLQKVKPKMFMNKPLTGSMLVELVQSVLNAINKGNIPIIENSWKYIVQSETIKNTNYLIDQFKSELNSFNESSKYNSSTSIKDRSKFIKDLASKYKTLFESNSLLDDETKDGFIHKFQSKLNSEIDKFNKESDIVLKTHFTKAIDDNLKEFIESFCNNDKYSTKTYYLFYQDIDAFIAKCEESSSPFPTKSQIILDTVLIIIKKFIDVYFIKAKNQSEKEIAAYKTAIDKLQSKFKANNDELSKYKQEHSSYLERINDSVAEDKLKKKNFEDKIEVLLNEKRIERERYERNIAQMKTDFEKKIENTFNSTNQSMNELRIKSEQMNIIKANQHKINSINDQKILFLDSELNNMKDKCALLQNEFKRKENNLLNEIALLKAQNESLINENKRSRKHSSEAISTSVGNLELILKDHLNSQSKENKFILEKFMNSQQMQKDNSAEIKNAYKNYKEISEENMKLNEDIAAIEDLNKKLEEQLNKMMCYKDIITNTIGFKCRSCLRVFAVEQFRLHFRKCQMSFALRPQQQDDIASDRNDNIDYNHIQNNSNDIVAIPNMKLRIIKDKVTQDEYNKPFIEYVISVEYNHQVWQINKRFNQFSSLYKSLKALFNGKLTLPFSSNIFMNVNEMYPHTSNHEKKISHLNRFITEIANIEAINQSKIFRSFFEFERYDEGQFASSFSRSRNNGYDIKEYSKDNSLYVNSRIGFNGYDYFDNDTVNH